jgi:L-aminopeptidase/D-esterase-like protein
LGIPFGGVAGEWSAVTDVPGVEVGYATLIEGESTRTGVTAIHPRGRANPGDPVTAGFFSQNGNGEMTGRSWVEESGNFAGPVLITNTHAVGVAHDAIIDWTATRHPDVASPDTWLLPVAAETWDGYLNDINGRQVTNETCLAALDSARSGPIEEGSVGGGTGMNCYQFKAGSGTASRVVPYFDTAYTVGVFLQANFGARNELVLAGEPLGQVLAEDNPMADYFAGLTQGGSVIGIVATDAPLLPLQCTALARRVTMGIARTGASSSHFSGDLFLAFSTGNPNAFATSARGGSVDPASRYGQLRFIPWGRLDPFYTAVCQGVEEAVANALTAGEEMTGRAGHRSPGFPRDRVAEIFRSRAR